MSGNEKISAKTHAAWIAFPKDTATLQRFDIDGYQGLILRATDSAEGSSILDRALANGFAKMKVKGAARIVLPDGKFPSGIRAMAENLGGEIVALRRDILNSADYLIKGKRRAPEGVQPEATSNRLIGINLRGEEVFQDAKSRFIRRADGEGNFSFIAETGMDQHSLFLRARKDDDYPAIVSGLIRRARRGTVDLPVFDQAVRNAIEGWEGESYDAAAGKMRRELMRQAATAGLEGDAGRDVFSLALRIGGNIGAIARGGERDPDNLNPSPELLTLIRRFTRDSSHVDFKGAAELALACPPLPREGGKLQVLDLTSVAQDDLSLTAMSMLSRRENGGDTVLMVRPGDEDLHDDLRAQIGRHYGIATVAHVSGSVASGRISDDPVLIYFISDRRPEVLSALPQAAMRTFQVNLHDDLLNLEREILRARSKIREFNQGMATEAEVEVLEENDVQRPYPAVSGVRAPYTMLPKALEGASIKGLERLKRWTERHGGIDGYVGSLLGMDMDTLEETFLAEQVDAIAMRQMVAERGRGFLVGDDTGIGKTHTEMGIARAHLRAHPDNRVLVITESAMINVPDVLDVFMGIGGSNEIGPHINPEHIKVLTTGSRFRYTVPDPVDATLIEYEISSEKAADRKEIFESEAWPDDCRMIVTTHSQFNKNETGAQSLWMQKALDPRVLIIGDEIHNATNKKSNTGRNIRAGVARVGNQNFMAASATPMGAAAGLELFKPMMPAGRQAEMETLIENITSGGETAMEAAATMLAEDGVYLRRVHDISKIDMQVALPDDATMARYQEVRNLFSPIMELFIDLNLAMTETVQTARREEIRQQIQEFGVDEQVAIRRASNLNQYKSTIGSPLSLLDRAMINALKVDQAVDLVIQKMEEGFKPLIAFHSTNASIIQEMARDENGNITDESMADMGHISLRDQLTRVHEKMYRLRRNGDYIDMREEDEEIAQRYEVIREAIAKFPDTLSASPIDAIIEKLEARDISIGEISGRSLAYRNGRALRRKGIDRKKTVDDFNNGELDVLAYNSAGATGGNFHASPKCKDQRPRCLIDLESPTNTVKFLQGLGRVNRFGQVAAPQIVSLVTGLVSEMRLIQQRNNRLRSLGASVDGNRSHPLLHEKTPDLLNKVGDEATLNVMQANPTLAIRMGLRQVLRERLDDFDDFEDDAHDTGSGSAGSEMNLANKVLARSGILTSREQDELVSRITLEFEALIEEYESRNANPLKPRELPGRIEIIDSEIFTGAEATGEDDIDSAFTSPLMVSTGRHFLSSDAVSGAKVIEMVETCRRLYGSDGFKPWADRLQQNLHAVLLPHLDGGDIHEMIADPSLMPPRMRQKFNRMQRLGYLLENIAPGVEILTPEEQGEFVMTKSSIVVDMVPPGNAALFDTPTAYKVKLISPGDDRPWVASLNSMMRLKDEDIRFRLGLSDSISETIIQRFDEEMDRERVRPVQILHGNTLQAISQASQNDLGTISLFRDTAGQVHRGVVVSSWKLNLKVLPFKVPSSLIAAETFVSWTGMDAEARKSGPSNMIEFWCNLDGSRVERKEGKLEDLADIAIRLTTRYANIRLPELRKSSYEFFEERPGLHEVAYGSALPAKNSVRPSRARKKGGFNIKLDLHTEEGVARTYAIMALLSEVPLMTNGRVRPLLNEVTNNTALLEVAERASREKIDQQIDSLLATTETAEAGEEGPEGAIENEEDNPAFDEHGNPVFDLEGFDFEGVDWN